MTALGLELILVRVLGLAFGSESFGMLGVLAGYFAGLAIGSAALHRAIIRSPRPVRIYIAAECFIAAYAVAGPALLISLADALPRVVGPVVSDNRSLAALSLNLTIAMLALLPATVCMGATTPALVEAWRRRRSPAANTSTVAWLYASNTLGGVLGIVLSIYWLLPAAGIRTASGILAAFSLLAAGLLWRWDRAGPTGRVEGVQPAGHESLLATVHSPGLLYGLLFFTGLAGIGLETVGTQVFAQIFENTVHTFANILIVFLLGTAMGAWLYAFTPAHRLTGDRDRATSLLLYALALSGIAAGAILARVPTILSALAPAGSPYGRRVMVETVVTALVFLPPTVCMGATFSHLLGYFTNRGVGLGAALNTAGATLAPFVFGLVLIPGAGYGVAFDSAVALYLVVFLIAHFGQRRAVWWAVEGTGLALAAMALGYSSLVLVRFPPTVRLVAQRTGLHGVVSVGEIVGSNAGGGIPARILLVDQHQQMGGSPGGVEKRMGHLPMLLVPGAKDVLFLGVGTGITAGAALSYPVEHVTAVDLLPEIVDMLPWFGEFNAGLRGDARVTLHAADARRFVLATADRYDVIVADLYHPSRDGSASLYTQAHFVAIRSRLRDGGVFVQWLPLSQLRPQDPKTIVRTFLDAFPDAHSLIASYTGSPAFALVGLAPARDDTRPGVDVPRVEAIFRQRIGPREVFEGLPDVLATYMLDAANLKAYAGTGPLNTDDNQRVTFDAASAALLSEREAHRAMASLLPYRRSFPDAFVASAGAGGILALRQRVGPYCDAATHYLRAEIIVRETGGPTLPAEASPNTSRRATWRSGSRPR